VIALWKSHRAEDIYFMESKRASRFNHNACETKR